MHLRPILMTLFLVALQLGWSLISAEVHFKKGAPHVTLGNGGVISGKVEFSRDGRPYNSFIGIKYAKVPERFQEAKPVSVEGVYSATNPGPICSQMALFGEQSPDQPVVGEENCLNLNVYVPISNNGTGKKGFPVMVWVHGGGFMFGEGYGYGPQYFMDEDVILVTFNYRIGVFGFLSTADSVIPGNYGLKDMALALKWVQENIKQFGGDADKVTIFGESAGGAAVHHLMLSPKTNGLFHQAISQSGSVLNGWAYYPNPRAEAVELATYLKCPTTAAELSGIKSEEILRCLKGLTTEQLNRAQFAFKVSWPSNMRNFYFGPTHEPSTPVSSLSPFHAEPPVSLLTRPDSKLKEIPWMVGAVEEECSAMFAGAILKNPDNLKDMNTEWDRVSPQAFDYGKYISEDEQNIVSEKLKQFYFGDKEVSQATRDELTNIFSDEMFLHGVYKSALATASRGKKHPVYLYQYTYQGPSSLMGDIYQIDRKQVEKAGHADDIQHQFKFGGFGAPENDDAGKEKRDLDRDEKFSKNFVRLWASFAIHGEPKHSWGSSDNNHWKAVSKKELNGEVPLKWFRIDDSSEAVEVDQSVKERMQFWDKLWSEHITPGIMARYKPAGADGKTEL